MSSIEVVDVDAGQALGLEPRRERLGDQRAPISRRAERRGEQLERPLAVAARAAVEQQPGELEAVSAPRTAGRPSARDLERVGRGGARRRRGGRRRREQAEHPLDRAVAGGRAPGDDHAAPRRARAARRGAAARGASPSIAAASASRVSDDDHWASQRQVREVVRGERLEHRSRARSRLPSSAWVAASAQRQAGIAG